MKLSMPAFLAIILTCTFVILLIVFVAFPTVMTDSSMEHLELFMTSIVVNVVVVALLLKQMYDTHTDNMTKNRPWLGRAGNKKLAYEDDSVRMAVHNHGLMPATHIKMMMLHLTESTAEFLKSENEFVLSPGEEFEQLMTHQKITNMPKEVIIRDDNVTISSALKKDLLACFEDIMNTTSHPCFGCIIVYTDPTEKMDGLYLLIGTVNTQTRYIGAQMLRTR